MIQKLRIKNFQCHKRLEVDLDAKVTTFVGSSDRGKSAIIRALRWLCLNSPQGEEFVKYGEKGTTIQAIIDDEKITRRRGTGKNTYHFGEDEYKSFGTGVPDTIANKLRVSDINFQQQFDAPFWFALSPGEVSRQINQIVDLGIIDSTLSNISKVVRESQQESKFVAERLSVAKQKRDELEWCVEADIDMRRLEAAETDKASISRSAALLERAVSDVMNAEGRRENARMHAYDSEGLLSCATFARDIDSAVRDIARIMSEHNELSDLVDSPVPNFAPIESAWMLYDEMNAEIKPLRLLLSDIEDAIADLERLCSKMERVEQQFSDECNGVCPICGGDLDGYCDTTQGENLHAVS